MLVILACCHGDNHNQARGDCTSARFSLAAEITGRN